MAYAYALEEQVSRHLHRTAAMAHEFWEPLRNVIPLAGLFSAYSKVIAGVTSEHGKPKFNIGAVEAEGGVFPVREEIAVAMPFCDLVHFSKGEGAPALPRLLLVAPVSGHYATLLRDTVLGLLPHFDVYITDWKNAREVPLRKGRFDFHSFIDYCDAFLSRIEPDISVSVCQPGPAFAAALALRAQRGLKNPRAAVFMGSPMDVKAAPTVVTKLAEEHPLEWFEQNLICEVPASYPGAGRLVYPGKMQLMSFIAMNAEKHLRRHMKQVGNVLKKDAKAAAAHDAFYDEYFAVQDLPAEFFLQTVDLVFQKRALARGELTHRGQRVDLGAIRDMSVLSIEGGHDDICAPGQNSAILDLCDGVAERHKKAVVLAGAGHYGIFSGSGFRARVVPEICSFAEMALEKKRQLPRPARAYTRTARAYTA